MNDIYDHLTMHMEEQLTYEITIAKAWRIIFFGFLVFNVFHIMAALRPFLFFSSILDHDLHVPKSVSRHLL